MGAITAHLPFTKLASHANSKLELKTALALEILVFVRVRVLLLVCLVFLLAFRSFEHQFKKAVASMMISTEHCSKNCYEKKFPVGNNLPKCVYHNIQNQPISLYLIF